VCLLSEGSTWILTQVLDEGSFVRDSAHIVRKYGLVMVSGFFVHSSVEVELMEECIGFSRSPVKISGFSPASLPVTGACALVRLPLQVD